MEFGEPEIGNQRISVGIYQNVILLGYQSVERDMI